MVFAPRKLRVQSSIIFSTRKFVRIDTVVQEDPDDGTGDRCQNSTVAAFEKAGKRSPVQPTLVDVVQRWTWKKLTVGQFRIEAFWHCLDNLQEAPTRECPPVITVSLDLPGAFSGPYPSTFLLRRL